MAGGTLIVGRGWLGTRLLALLPGASFGSWRIDAAHQGDVGCLLDHERPDGVVNAAGFCAPNIDACEDDRPRAVRANALAPAVLGAACAARGIPLAHLSTTAVFAGPAPLPGGAWAEADAPNPASFYAHSKLAGEWALAGLPAVSVLRIATPVDAVPHPRNLVTKLAGFARVADVTGSLTVVADLAALIPALFRRRAAGVFHATNLGAWSHRDILAGYRALVDPALPEPAFVAPSDLGVRVDRTPCVVSSARLEALGLGMPNVSASVLAALAEYATHGSVA